MHPAPAPDLPPGLTALVVYQRPAPRRELLSAFADLGVFVVERQGLAGPDCGPQDLCLLVGRPGSDVEAAAALHARHGTLMVCLPPGSDGAGYQEAGAFRCIEDGQLGQANILAEAAQRARAGRAAGRAGAPLAVFGGLRFRPADCLLEGERGVAALSGSERAVLALLARTPGRPVPLSGLEGAACDRAETANRSSGLVKAVVLRLRRKAEGLGGDPGLLRTVRGFGYVLIG
jgi:hypothetical protein